MRTLNMLASGLKGLRSDSRGIERPRSHTRALDILVVPFLLIVAGALYAAFVMDANTARSALTGRHLVDVAVSHSLVEYDRLAAEMKRKHGETAQTILEGASGRIVVQLDGRTVEETAIARKLEYVEGAFFAGPRGETPSSFPFSIAPGRLQDALYIRTLNDSLKARFGKSAPAHVRRIAESEWSAGPCQVVSPSDLGVGELAQTQFEAATACVVESKKPSAQRAAIVAVVTSDDAWMGPFAKRLCRTIVESAVANPVFAPRPNFAACVLADRAVTDTPVSYVYEVRNDGSVAWIRRY